jgi:hypothetical protein
MGTASVLCATRPTADVILSSRTVVVWGKGDGVAEASASCGTVGETGRPDNEKVSSSAGILSDTDDRNVFSEIQGRSF